MWKLFIVLLFVGVRIKGQDEDLDCEECNDQIDIIIGQLLSNTLSANEPFEATIPDCEHCYVGGFTRLSRNNDSCVTEEEGFHVQITHFIVGSVMLNCSCDINTKSGSKRGGIHGTIEKAMFSIKLVGHPDEVANPEFYEDGHIGAEKLHIKCDGEDDFKKACDEEEHSYNVDNVVTAVGRATVEVLNSLNEMKRKMQCFYENE